ncbi:hypothetical protein [Clostridium sp. FP1]|uniref:hypothetical protein n=1 Tax=Clostridium sp. FP1 TaxID=2724076 RepID=UPI0013E90029|nr:hypothetical protein [Clostridium sp. FP1]MBZ9635519.1 hypothetical protein [Clostridium sp. FP1]
MMLIINIILAILLIIVIFLNVGQIIAIKKDIIKFSKKSSIWTLVIVIMFTFTTLLTVLERILQ